MLTCRAIKKIHFDMYAAVEFIFKTFFFFCFAKKETKKATRKQPHPAFGHLLQQGRELDAIFLPVFGMAPDVAFVLLW